MLYRWKDAALHSLFMSHHGHVFIETGPKMYPQNRYCLCFIVSNQRTRKPLNLVFQNGVDFLLIFYLNISYFTSRTMQHFFGRQSWIPKQPQILQPNFWAKLNMRILLLTHEQDSQKGLPLVDYNHNIFT